MNINSPLLKSPHEHEQSDLAPKVLNYWPLQLHTTIGNPNPNERTETLS